MEFPYTFPQDRRYDVAGFGTNAVDYLIRVPNYPEFGSKVELTEYSQAAGGEVATTMVGLARLGLKTAYAGRFGDDAAGDFGVQTLADEGVDISHAERIAGAGTQIAFIVIDGTSGERTVIWQRDAKLAFTRDEAPLSLVRDARVLHLTPHDTAACLAMAQAAKAAGTIVSIDIDNVFDGVEEVLQNVDILIASSEFPERFLGISDPRTALSEMRARFGCGIVGVTLGANGALLLGPDGQFVESAGFEVPGGCRDTTGAGDAFRVGLLQGFFRRESIADAARRANAVAALKCRAVGARTALPDPDELQAFLENS
ncbi:MAG: carbohydrate kinase family protein [Acidobacteriota bacterium]